MGELLSLLLVIAHSSCPAMNVSFFFLILVLFALAFLTSWNKHVLFLSGVTTLLWAAMLWSVYHLTYS
jgi:hypothetical protein